MNAINVTQLALNIKEQVETDPVMRAVCMDSPEFYRACVYESGLVNAAVIDGTDVWHKLIDELEALL
jgi:hypothetical protein